MPEQFENQEDLFSLVPCGILSTLNNGVIININTTLIKMLGYEPEEIGKIFETWNEGELNSYLVEITADILQQQDPKTGAPLVDMILDSAGQKGTGRWTSISATQMGVPAGIISESVYARALSTLTGERELAEVYVVADSPAPVPPCGGCRQKLKEFGATDVKVTMGTVDGVEQETTIGDLLPGAFEADHMARS